jgi:outer membrane lipase/esterase
MQFMARRGPDAMHGLVVKGARYFLVALLVAPSGQAAAQSFSQFIGFGDSTIDSGWYRNAAPNSNNPLYNTYFAIAVTQGGGRATTNPGLISSQYLASYFGLSATPANQPGGTNYATGDGRNALSNAGVPGGLLGAVPTVTQIGNYLAANSGVANPAALYLINSGGNDISYASGNLPQAAQLPSVLAAAQALVAGVQRLALAGAQYIVVPDQPQSFGGATLEALRRAYDNALWGGLAAAHVNFIPADINAMYRTVSSDPSMFGLIANGGPACTQPAGITSGWAIFCSPTSTISTLVAPNAELTHLFADDEHLSTAGQKIVADYEYSLIVAPSEISLLAEAPVKTRIAMIEGMFDQIAISQHQRGVGTFNAWITGDVASLAINAGYPGFPGDPGTPVAATVGVDYAFAPDWLVGGAMSVGNTTQSFSSGGNFQQNEFAASAYAAFARGPIWADAIGSIGVLQDNVNRAVPIGMTSQSNTGSTSGTNVSLAAEGGYNFYTGPFSQGPLAGILLQQVRINGYTETDAFAAVGGFTALSFAAQTRNSTVSELGYQASVDIGAWSPFAKVAWDHEFASTTRLVTVSLTSISAPSYSLPAVALGTDWATVSAGTSVRISRNVMGYAMFMTELGQDNVTYYGGQVGLNVALGSLSSISKVF